MPFNHAGNPEGTGTDRIVVAGVPFDRPDKFRPTYYRTKKHNGRQFTYDCGLMGACYGSEGPSEEMKRVHGEEEAAAFMAKHAGTWLDGFLDR